MNSDMTDKKVSSLENQVKQLLLKVNRLETELRELQSKHRSLKVEFNSIRDLTSNRRYG